MGDRRRSAERAADANALAQLIGAPLIPDLTLRAAAATGDLPVLNVSPELADQWVLVPRRHLRTIASWNGEIDEVGAVLMISEIFADAKLLGVEDHD